MQKFYYFCGERKRIVMKRVYILGVLVLLAGLTVSEPCAAQKRVWDKESFRKGIVDFFTGYLSGTKSDYDGKAYVNREDVGCAGDGVGGVAGGERRVAGGEVGGVERVG